MKARIASAFGVPPGSRVRTASIELPAQRRDQPLDLGRFADALAALEGDEARAAAALRSQHQGSQPSSSCLAASVDAAHEVALLDRLGGIERRLSAPACRRRRH